MLKCPNCRSENINQCRMTTGPIWCGDCDFKAPEKERYNPFYQPQYSEGTDNSTKTDAVLDEAFGSDDTNNLQCVNSTIKIITKTEADIINIHTKIDKLADELRSEISSLVRSEMVSLTGRGWCR